MECTSMLPRAALHRNSPSSRRLVSIADAAEYADVHPATIRRYISSGRLTGYRVGPRLVKIDLAELNDLARPIPTAADYSGPAA